MNRKMLKLNGLVLMAAITFIMADGCVKIIAPPRTVGERQIDKRTEITHSPYVLPAAEDDYLEGYQISLIPEPRSGNPTPTPAPEARPVQARGLAAQERDVAIPDPAAYFDPQPIEEIETLPQDGRSLPIIAVTEDEEEAVEEAGAEEIGKVGGAVPVLTPAAPAQPPMPSGAQGQPQPPATPPAAPVTPRVTPPGAIPPPPEPTPEPPVPLAPPETSLVPR